LTQLAPSHCDSDSPLSAAGGVILVVDDEPSICWAFERMLGEEGHRVLAAGSAEDGLKVAAEERPDMVLLDVRLPRQDGITALPKFLEATGNAPVVVMTAFGDLETAVSAIRSGASDYLIKPFRLEDAKQSCRNALRAAAGRGGQRATADPPPRKSRGGDALVGTSPAMQQAFRQIALVARSDLSVLITGETGTGKELVAAAIHRNSHRSAAPYLPIAPVALNPDLIERELFGHVSGAFTGADEDRPGLFEAAGGGTVLLDEIGDLPSGTQVKLLRVLEQGQYTRVGEARPRQCDVRILAATNCDLHRAVQEGRFREDLFYRLTGVQIHLPPLRQRDEDIRPLCEHFLERMGYPLGDAGLDDELINTLRSRPWYGNVRELRNAVEHAAVVARGRPLAVSDFPPPQPGRCGSPGSTETSLRAAVGEWASEAIGRLESDPSADLHSRFLKAAEPALLRVVLEHTGGNRAKASELLGIHRATLRERMREYGIEPEP